MPDSIQISASIRVERPVEIVRQQFRNIDHRVYDAVHPDIQHAWEPDDGGPRRFRTTFRILGVEQHDVCTFEDAADGSFVIRYLEGTNGGMVLTHRFAALGPEATQVELNAEAPATLGRKLLGPLFGVGVRQVLRKALVESKRDLEQERFVAGKAAGNLEHALAFLKPPTDGGMSFVRPLADRSLAAKRAVLDASCLIAVADSRLDPSELDALTRLAQLIGASDERAWLVERGHELAAVCASEGVVAEATRIGRTLVTEGVGLEGITAAVVVALVSEGMSLGELELLRVLAGVAGVSEGSLPAVVERAERGLLS